ncbi:hypothetical protein CR513_38131, partial [Mucuna pruriens]
MVEVKVIPLGPNDLSKLFDIFSLTMKGKSSFNIFYFVSQIANGDHVPIVGFGSIQLQFTLSLLNVFHVSNLTNNFISIHRLAQDLNCIVTFYHSHCVFQDLASWRTILIAKKQVGLTFYNTRQLMIETEKRESLLITKQPQKLRHHRTSFLPSNSKNVVPFDLIHSNVWGPITELVVGARWFVTLIDVYTCLTWTYLMKHKFEILFISFLVSISLNKMGLQNEKIVIFLRLSELYSLKCPYQMSIRESIITLKIVGSLCQWISPFTKHNPFLSVLHLGGRVFQKSNHKEVEEEDHYETKKEERFFGIKYQRQKKPTPVP